MLRVGYQRFHYYFSCFKNMHFNRILSLQEGLQIPIGAVIHDINDFILSENHVPDIAKWAKLFPYAKYFWVYHNTLVPRSDFKSYEIPEKYRVLTIGVNSSITHFRTAHSNVKTIIDQTKFDRTRKDVLNMVNDRPILNVKITGVLAPLQLVEHGLNALLDKVYYSPTDLMHYIPVKLGNHGYKRTDFAKIFSRGFSLTTVNHIHDATYITLAYLLTYCLHPDQDEIVTPFHKTAKLDQALHNEESEHRGKEEVPTLDKRVSFIFHTDNHYFIYSIADLKAMINESIQNVDKFLAQVTKTIEESETIASYDPVQEMKKDNIDLTEATKEEEHPPIDPEEDHPNITPHTTTLIKEDENNKAPEHQPTKVNKPIVIEAATPVHHDTQKTTAPKATPSKAVPLARKEELKEVTHDNKVIVKKVEPPRRKVLITHEHPALKTQETIDKPMLAFIEANTKGYTPAQKERIMNNAMAYKSLTLGSKTLEQMMNETNGLKPNEAKDFSFLEAHVADPSYLKSAIANLSGQFATELQEREHVAAFLSFNKTGKFLVDVQSEVTQNKLENFTTYTVTFEDINFKRSTHKIIVPNINPDGTIISRGSIKKIYPQRINKPICKISPTRVALFSDYYKSTVDLISPSRTNLVGIVSNLLIKKNPNKLITFRQGKFTDPKHVYPLELAQLATAFQWIKIGKITLSFDLKAIPYIPEREVWQFGSAPDGTMVYIDMKNNIFIEKDNNAHSTSILNWIVSVLNKSPDGKGTLVVPPIIQWTEIGIINKSIPIGLVLSYQFGIEKMLEMIGADYDLYDRDNTRGRIVPPDVRSKSICIDFKDKILVVAREPYAKSFIVAGLSKYDLSEYSFADLNEKESYYNIFTDAKFPPIIMTEIENFFLFFIDPVMKDLLLYMNEPTDPEGLLIRATEMLTTTNHEQSSSVKNFRTRCHGKIPAILYNEMSRQMAASRRNDNNNGKVSINPQAVFLRVVQDALTENADINNPIGAIKDMTTFCYTGFGGRTAESFVVRDRQYPEDGQGIISEATIDSGNVAIRAQYCLDPNIVNLHGMEEAVDLKDVEPGNLLSISALLWPGLTTNDGCSSSRTPVPSTGNSGNGISLIAGTR